MIDAKPMPTTVCPFCHGNSRQLFNLPHGQVMQCHDCGLQFLDPQPTDQELAKRYGDLYYSESRIYTQTEKSICTQIIQNHLLPLISKNANPLILDYGTGDGEMVRELKKLGYGAYGIDPFGKTDPQKGTYASYELFENDIKPEFGVDLILLNEVVEHLRTPWQTLQELWGYVRPGGAIYVSTPHFSGLRSLVLRGKYEQYLNPTHLFYFTPRSLQKVLDQAFQCKAQRMKTQVQYPHRPWIGRIKDRLLQESGMDGDLKYFARKP